MLPHGEIMDNKGHLDFWNNVANSQPDVQHNWNKVYKNYTATVDNPGCCVWQELIKEYPEAKVLLTLHPGGPEAWYESTINTIYRLHTLWQFKVQRLVTPSSRGSNKFDNMSAKLIWERSHKNTMNNKNEAITRYHEHIEEIKALVPEDNLLVFSVDQGWEPLCSFLGVPIPDTDFPNTNDRAEMQKNIANRRKKANTRLTVGAVIIAGLAFGLIKLLL